MFVGVPTRFWDTLVLNLPIVTPRSVYKPQPLAALGLAAASADDVKAILEASTSKLSHLDPGTWAQQAQLAADGKMDELKTLQDQLNGGK